MSSSPESRDEAREKALAAFMEYFRTNYPGPDTIISRPDWHAPKIFRAVEYALKDAGLVASPSETAPKWIPVSECLPEGDGAVLGYGKDYTGEWIDTFGRSYVRQRSGLITHWMPLPAAPVDANRHREGETK
jgi:hypothetical protein